MQPHQIIPQQPTKKISHSNLLMQMCGMFLLEDSKSIVDMLVNQGKDRAAMEAELSWYFHSFSLRG